MTILRSGPLAVLLVFGLLNLAGASPEEESAFGQLRGSIRRYLQEFHHSLDARWKSTKLTPEQKAALGIHPPPGYEAEYEAIIAKQKADAAAAAAAGEGGEVEDTGAGDMEYPGEENVGEEQPLTEENWEAEVQADEAVGGGDLEIIDTAVEAEAEEEQLDADPDDGANEPNRRKFVSYTPSKWESGWSDNIEDMAQSGAICRTLLHGKHQTKRLHEFLEMTCTARAAEFPNWCYYHDHNHFMWYNSENLDEFEIYIDKTPLVLEDVETPEVQPLEIYPDPIVENVASELTFYDEFTGEEYVEYIEPLVAQLRFPLAECENDKPLYADFASYVIPPPVLDRVPGRTLMYDLGSKDWSRMEYVVEEWTAHSIEFEYVISYDTDGNEAADNFLTTVPEWHKSKIFRHYFQLVDHPTTDENQLFIPDKIMEQARPDDYVLLKLDRANANLKSSIVQYILDNDVHVDEIIWEINAQGNYVMNRWFETNRKFEEISSMSLAEAYNMLVQLRNKGIRAHSWI